MFVYSKSLFRSHYILLFLGAPFILLLSGCNSRTLWNDVEFYNVEKLEKLTEAPISNDSEDAEVIALPETKENREMDVKIDMQFLKSNNETNEKVCKLINDQLIELLLKQSSEMSVDEAIAQYVEDIKRDFHGDEVANIYYDHLKGRAEYGKEGVINYRLVEEVFTGGAHPCTITTILRFDTTTGAFIALEHVFPTLNQSKLQDVLLQKLMKNVHAASIDDLHSMGILEMTDMFISPNFALRGDSVEFYYNEYDIAPYAYGACTLCLSYAEANDLMDVTWQSRR